MPIYHKTGASSGGHNTADIDYHTSEAAKVKRTREQAYFNSYDFDAIEVLPYDDEEDEDDEKMRGTRKERGKTNSQTKQQQLKTKPLRPQQLTKSHHLQMLEEPVKPQKSHPHHFSFSNNNDSSSSNSFMVDKPSSLSQQQQQHHVYTKYNPSPYIQRISGIFSGKSNHHNNKPLHHGNGVGVLNVGTTTTDIALNSHHEKSNNKHLILSSSETSSTSLSNSSIIIEEIVSVRDDDDDDDDDGDIDVAGVTGISVGNESVIASSLNKGTSGNRAAVTGDVIGTRSKSLEANNTTNTSTPLNATSTPTTNATSPPAANGGNSGGNFSLPRAMLKYQSSTLNAIQTGASGNTTNSMPLATNASSNSNNNNINNSPLSNNNRQQLKQQPLKIVATPAATRDIHGLDGLKGNGNIMPSNVAGNLGLRLKKTSTSSSVITSLASEDIEEVVGLEDNIEHGPKEEKVLPKTIIKPKVAARAASHQSHYSTDKSASSGYYSSNVCSTYSLEEHIYSEPTIDLKKLRNHGDKESQASTFSKSEVVAAIANVPLSAANTLQNTNKLDQQLITGLMAKAQDSDNVMLALNFNKRYRYNHQDADEIDVDVNSHAHTLPSKRSSQEFNDNLKILESSIENLDRHLKAFPGNNSQEAFNPYNTVNQNDKLRSASSYNHLPTIQEGFDAVKKQSWHEERSDDSLMDIDLDSFLLDKEQKLQQKTKQTLNPKGLDNPTFLPDEQEENHYKCAKYINSCPEDAYRVESDIHGPARSSISGQSVAASVDLYPKRYEEQIHFQNTRELLEDVRDKIRLLTQTQEAEQKQMAAVSGDASNEDYIPKELHNMINTLKQELELYLDRMNQHSELEIRQLCTGLVKNQHIVKMKNAFERRKSLSEVPDIYSTYEAIQDGIVVNAQGVPISIRQQITSIRCTSDPNFKMKRKSITEVFPMAQCYIESTKDTQQQQQKTTTSVPNESTQMQKNLSYHKPVLESINTNSPSKTNSKANNTNTEAQDKDSILDWHRKKPSIWELYYGTNRMQQSLLVGKKNGTMLTTAIASSPSTMCYPSSRPESDFTLDMPRAEQLRIKMEKEKKFRQRCRVITTFLSLVFFLLTVMVVSLVLTRGRRMFGSMI